MRMWWYSYWRLEYLVRHAEISALKVFKYCFKIQIINTERAKVFKYFTTLQIKNIVYVYKISTLDDWYRTLTCDVCLCLLAYTVCFKPNNNKLHDATVPKCFLFELMFRDILVCLQWLVVSCFVHFYLIFAVLFLSIWFDVNEAKSNK